MNRRDRRLIASAKRRDVSKLIKELPLMVPLERFNDLKQIVPGEPYVIRWEFGSPMEAPSPEDVIEYGGVVLAMVETWINNISRMQPMCSLCDRRWTSPYDEPPAILSIISSTESVMCLPTCLACYERPGTLREKSGVAWDNDVGAMRLAARSGLVPDIDRESMDREEEEHIATIQRTVRQGMN